MLNNCTLIFHDRTKFISKLNPVKFQWQTRDGNGKDGSYEDRGGFWRPVDWWHRDAEHFASLFQKGMRVVVLGREERDDWTDEQNNPRTTYRINARGVGILPYRIDSVTMSPKQATPEQSPPSE